MDKEDVIELLVEMKERCNMPKATDPKRFKKSRALEIAIKAVEEDEEVAPKLKYVDPVKDILPEACCGNCGKKLYGYKSYCSYCGSQVAWSK